MSQDPLDPLRRQLNEVDRDLLERIAERERIVAEIGQVKRAANAPTRDFARERRVIDHARQEAEDLGLDPELAASVMRVLITGSLTRQEIDRVRAGAPDENRTALVLGGAGKMGRWFADFLASQGFRVSVCDPASSPSPHPTVSDWQEGVDDWDVIVVAAPIEASAALLDELAESGASGLIFDIASLKSPLRASLRRLADAGCRVCSLHPMFGPDTRMLSGRHVIGVDLGDSEALEEARQLFENTMAEWVSMSLEDHDRMVAYVLGLSHALNIAFFTALRESGEASERLSELSSTTFDSQLRVARSVADENPYLYFEIQSLNDYRLAPLNALSDALGRVKRMVESGDEPGFVRLMEQGRHYLSQRGNAEP